jgi:hypothetical protein
MITGETRCDPAQKKSFERSHAVQGVVANRDNREDVLRPSIIPEAFESVGDPSRSVSFFLVIDVRNDPREIARTK